MGTNSIRSNLTKDDIISTIRLDLSADPHKPIIIVEGIDDIGLLKNICHENVIISESYNGRSGVFEILNHILQFDKKGSVIGICDRDYECISHTKVFYYDFCCLEMMVFSNNGMFEKILSLLGLNTDEISRHELLKLLLPISLMRQKNILEKLGVNFEGISLSKSLYYEESNLENLKKELSRVNPRISSRHIEKKIKEIRQDFVVQNSEEDLLTLTQGHDFIALLQIFHGLKCNKKTQGSDSIRLMMNAAYTATAFSRTNIFNEISNYSSRHNVCYFRE